MKKTLLLVFIHGFKGNDHTFEAFPQDLRTALGQALPKINVVAVQYPQYETRGDLRSCVARLKEWLQNKVIDLEVANNTPSPTVDPSVHVVLCGHSMGGIVAAEALLSIARDEPVPSSHSYNTTNTTEAYTEARTTASSPEVTRLFFPYVRAVLAFDTPYLGISPGVLAHGAEEQATTAYKAFDTASKLFGWGSPKSSPSTPNVAAPGRGLPAPETNVTGSSKWGKYAMYGGAAAAAVAGVAGAAYLNRNQINQGIAWAGSHLEFVGCLAKGAELQKRVEKVVDLTRTHEVGFANFYGALSEQVSSKTKYAGAMLGADRTFCVIPKNTRKVDSPPGSKRDYPELSSEQPPPKRRKSKGEVDLSAEMEQGEQVREFADDTTKSKGRWVKCVNPKANDEITSHTAMFSPDENPDYRAMLPRARDYIADWIDTAWYESSTSERREQQPRADDRDAAVDDDDGNFHDETPSNVPS